MKKEKIFTYVIKAMVLFLIYISVTGCGGGDTTTSSSSEDKSAPILSLVGETIVEVTLGSKYEDAGATAFDNKDGNITDKIVINKTKVDTSKLGDYIVTYNVTDRAGNKAPELKRTVKVMPVEEAPIVMKYPWNHGALKVVQNEKMLEHADGTGFFWMADTAWFLYKKTKPEIDLYMKNRAEKMFTVIQAVAAHNHGSYRTTEYNKSNSTVLAFSDYGIRTPNETYWEHIDYIIQKAEEKGLYVALLPVWRDAMMMLARNDIQRTFVTENDAREYGKWIANRYKDKPNIIWVIGGDAPLDGKWATEANMSIEEQVKRWNALGAGIKSVVGSTQLKTFHPGPKVKKPLEALGLGKNDWVDFNMIQSSRFGPIDSIKDIKFVIKEGLPAVDGESLYEDLAYRNKTNYEKTLGSEDVRRTAFQIREDAYSQIFAGAFGNTYGHDAIWRFCVNINDSLFENDQACGSRATFLLKPRVTWKKALDADGGKQMQYVTELMKSRPIVGRKPDQTLINGEPNNETSGIVATLGKGYAMVYSAQGKSFTVEMGKVSGAKVKAWWYNPRDGVNTLIGTFKNTGTQEFNPPNEPTSNPRNGNDWVLVLDDTSKDFAAPGK